jgi:hypothetical protein
MMSEGKNFTLFRTCRGLAALRHPFGVARFPVRNSMEVAAPSLCRTKQHKNEVSTLSGDLTMVEEDSPIPHVLR